MNLLSKTGVYATNSDSQTTARNVFLLGFVTLTLLFQGCAAVNTFPMAARPGDTVSVMVGGSEKANEATTDVTLTDAAGTPWDLQALGLVRSVFNLRADHRAHGTHYSPWLDSEFSWIKGHEPVQTVLVIDIPSVNNAAANNAAPGPATLTVNTNVDDDSSGVFTPFNIALDILDSTLDTSLIGSSDEFLRKNIFPPTVAASFEDLEPAPHAKISFGDGRGGLGTSSFGAASVIVDFDDTVVNGGDLNVYVSESTVKGTQSNQTGPFGGKQRMVYWRQSGSQLLIDVIAPQGIEGRYLQMYVLHPRGLAGDPMLSLSSIKYYDLDGSVNTTLDPPTLTYTQ